LQGTDSVTPKRNKDPAGNIIIYERNTERHYTVNTVARSQG